MAYLAGSLESYYTLVPAERIYPSLYKEASAADWDFGSACSEMSNTKPHVLCPSMHRAVVWAAAAQRLLALSVLSTCPSSCSSGFQETKDHPWLCLASSLSPYIKTSTRLQRKVSVLQAPQQSQLSAGSSSAWHVLTT